MTDKRCPDCKWSFKPELAAPLQCRRNPPNVSAFMVPGRLQGQAQIVTNASFPPVDATTWCGEFAASPALPNWKEMLAATDHLVDDVAG